MFLIELKKEHHVEFNTYTYIFIPFLFGFFYVQDILSDLTDIFILEILIGIFTLVLFLYCLAKMEPIIKNIFNKYSFNFNKNIAYTFLTIETVAVGFFIYSFIKYA